MVSLRNRARAAVSSSVRSQLKPRRCGFSQFWRGRIGNAGIQPASVIQLPERHPEDDMSDDPMAHTTSTRPLVVSTKWRGSGCLFLVAPAKEAVRNSTIAGSTLCVLRDGRAAASSGGGIFLTSSKDLPHAEERQKGASRSTHYLASSRRCVRRPGCPLSRA
jgi:hypothetical protein